MELKEALKRLEGSSEFIGWKKEHADAFLAHAFVMLDEPNKETVQLGFFDSAKDRMTTFLIELEKISMLPESEVFKSGQKIMPLKRDDMGLDVAKAIQIADDYRNENYRGEMVLKKFFIVQCLDIGCVFNITFFMKSFKTLNVKISVSDGKVIKHSFESIISGFG